jgi:hypothetical protein
MKILISSDGMHAHFYVRTGWAKAFSYSGHEVVLWDTATQTAFDIFDEFEPDLFIGQTYNVTKPVFQCISERPDLKVIMKAPDWGDIQKEIDPNKYNVLFVTDEEKRNMERLKKETGKPDFVYVHYLDEDVERTHNGWGGIGIRTTGLLNAADIFEYVNGKEIDYLKSDVSFVGGCWPYKAVSFNKYMTQLFYPPGKYNIKIFGNQPWNVISGIQYMGFISDSTVRDVLKSATVCPNISEPHAQDFGIDVNERTFKILSNKSFCISDNVEAMRKIFGDDEVVFTSPSEFKGTLDHFIEHPEERQSYIEKGHANVMENHTYFNRCAKIFDLLDMKKHSNNCLLALEKFTDGVQSDE